ncbi:sialidase-3-like isoform X1 [Patiria miniata]|uniref:Sialidase domain-containing protein n=1 Tax=Patiria miniata TaxID=46514 RepID=A0A913YX62_PATMI|nr:sialidase-3-like isoform X1 [Patiria miniata]
MLSRQIRMTLKRIAYSVRPSCQLVLIVLGVLTVVWVLILLQRPLEDMASTKNKRIEVPRPKEYATKKAYETDIEIVYKQGFLGYNTSRIPALVYHQGYFLAFCEARKETFRDIGSMDLVVRRGRRLDWKVQWGEVIVVVTKPGYRVMNPCPIVDKDLEAIVLVFIAIPAHLSQWTMVEDGFIQQQVMVTRSFDNGLTWTYPRDITASTLGKMRIPPGIYAPGPGHGIQTSSGKLVIPGNYFVKDKFGSMLKFEENIYDNANYANVIYSSDGGVSWHLGGSIPYGTDASGWTIHSNEAMVVEMQEGVLMLNTRTLHPDLPRVQSWSRNEGHSFSSGKLVPELIEPGYKLVNNETQSSKAAGCQASLIGFPAPHHISKHKTWLAFSNPASMFREHMSVRLSRDGGRTYTNPWTIYDLPAAYSDLTYFETLDRETGLKLQNFAILFEGGTDTPYEKIMFKMFNLDALLSRVPRTIRRHRTAAGSD